MNRRLGATICALLLAGCGLSSGITETRTTRELGEIVLAVGEEVTISGTVVRIGFERVSEDSRCPVDVVCVWEGNAAAEISLTAGSGPTQLRTLHTALDPRFTDFAGVRVTLVDVEPEPYEGEPIPAESYVIRLRLEPLPA
jgi:hypothetical protein